jgi:hypothetical protein
MRSRIASGGLCAAPRGPIRGCASASISAVLRAADGNRRYLYHLLHEIAKRDDVELFLFGDARVTDIGPTLQADVPPGAHVCWFDLRGRGKISRAQRAITAAAYVLWMALIDSDVMFAPNYFLPRLLGAIARRRVITIHDLTYKRFPDLLQKETLHNLEAHMMREIALADAVICVRKRQEKISCITTRSTSEEYSQSTPASHNRQQETGNRQPSQNATSSLSARSSRAKTSASSSMHSRT